jgi:hypothetical protein
MGLFYLFVKFGEKWVHVFINKILLLSKQQVFYLWVFSASFHAATPIPEIM